MKHWPLNKGYFWERAPFFRLLLPLAAGIGSYSRDMGRSFILWTIIVATAAFLSFLFSSTIRRQNSITNTISFIGLHLCLFLTAWIACYYHDARNNAEWMGNSLTSSEAYVARVTRAPVEKEKTWKLEVDVTHAVGSTGVEPAAGKAFVYVYKYQSPALSEGDIILVPNRWERIKNRGNPFELDYAAYVARENIYYHAFISGKDIVIHSYSDEEDLSWIRRIHYWCLRQLERHLTDRATLGLLKAMLFDDRDMLEGDLTEAYSETGIVHIIAISGGHITIFFVLVAFLLSWIKHRKYHWVKYISAIPLVWIYVVVAGGPPSAVRAALMFTILGVGYALQKTPNGINQLLATAFILLCADPMWLYSVGFQLSFVAVLSIMLFYRPVFSWFAPVNKLVRMLWSAVAVSIAAEILVAPLVVYYFHLFPLQFIVANVLAYFFMGVVLVLGMILIAVSSFYPVAQFIATIVTALTGIFNKTVYGLQRFNFSSFHSLTLTELQLALLYITIAGISIFLLKRNKPALFAGVAALALFVASSCVVRWQALQQEMLIVYNAGKDSRIELITGTSASILQGRDSVNEAAKKFVLEPAHINLHIDEIKRATKKYNLVHMADKRIFILDKPVADTLIPVDYVVVTGKYADVATIRKVFDPKLLVITGNPSRQKIVAIRTAAERAGLQVHDIRENGAFVLTGQ